MKTTKWQKQLSARGFAIIDFTHEEIMEHLLQIFKREQDELLLDATLDNTKRHNLEYILDFSNITNKLTIFGGKVNYSKKLRKFNYITYSDNRNYAVMFGIESKVAHFCYNHYKAWQHIFPFGASVKKMAKYLLSN